MDEGQKRNALLIIFGVIIFILGILFIIMQINKNKNNQPQGIDKDKIIDALDNTTTYETFLGFSSGGTEFKFKTFTVSEEDKDVTFESIQLASNNIDINGENVFVRNGNISFGKKAKEIVNEKVLYVTGYHDNGISHLYAVTDQKNVYYGKYTGGIGDIESFVINKLDYVNIDYMVLANVSVLYKNNAKYNNSNSDDKTTSKETTSKETIPEKYRVYGVSETDGTFYLMK